ncbi:acetyl-CoA carboxylase biotin carboxylase subunit [Sinimarinibacterium sp. CAU 1509]|uniref:acetyl-CoA carboxylase biotin carboxylase subunit n=1 Tax=Sinimarinibacterium sp. CAU 1509 TaxID=2562283 RepID=UPI0010AB9736|nr:acetyl-CoA carboxylase biotin carboxylase subunit [Sinimarinibacterium sp. CAU 1509]TJY60861.1 acetyl-CoA carboxylase biotin carboxylase subunit [Sinimarinibacterium sp. CAU 1509]
MTQGFNKVLVANRGEIAVRVITGARRAGYRTVAVYSEADRDALHVRMADEAVCIGPPPAAESYLVAEKIIEAARRSGAQAIHPGYGFLSERDDFAQAVVGAGLIFIGPDAASIRAMGNKSASKRLMLDAGVPCVPGYQGDAQDDETLSAEALRIGLPVMVKAAAGGGGRGMRRVDDAATLSESIRSARSEAQNAFGDGQLLIEKAVVDARHVEIQVFGDRHGGLVHLGERECSVQRRNQKVVEEAPSPAVDAELRVRMGEAAVAAARAVNYVGAGTVEFLLGADGQFYFLEMNTRLQVEHPVTEMVYGVDLVDWQLRIAQGEPLPLTQAQIDARRNGWAIEVRLCAEDPSRGYMPQTGSVLQWQYPEGSGLRMDAGLLEGQQISPFYDSMQAKLIAWGADREQARGRLLAALEQTRLSGVHSNKALLGKILSHPEFVAGCLSTNFIERNFPQAALAADHPSIRQIALAALALYLDDTRRLADANGLSTELMGWHSSHASAVGLILRCREVAYSLSVRSLAQQRFIVEVADESIEIQIEAQDPQRLAFVMDGVREQAAVARDADTIWLDAWGRCESFQDVTFAPAEAVQAGSDGRLLANSDGKIVAIHVAAGDAVQSRQTLVVLEAMKMEFQLTLPVGGTVGEVAVVPGQQVKHRQLLLRVDQS